MVFAAPPATVDGPIPDVVLPAGTELRRVHPATIAADVFDFPKSSVFGGGRFDATPECGYRTLCASTAPETALAERFLREFAATPGVRRVLLRDALEGQVLSTVRTTADLRLIRLTSAPDFAAVHQDSLLITSRPDTFPATREWARWLHDAVPWAQGILWQSVADMPRDTVVLFDDRCTGVASGTGIDLDSPDHGRWLADLLDPYGVRTELTVPGPPKFFVNYRTGDGDDASRLVHNELVRRFGEKQVFRDTVSIRVGSPDFSTVLLSAVRGCAVLLPIIGKNWEWCADRAGNRHLDNEQDWVRREILEARACGALVIPVLVGLRGSLAERNLPAALHFLTNSQFLHLPRGFGAEEVRLRVDRLVEDNPALA